MMKNLIKACALALALSGAIPLMAQPQAGDWEFTLGGSGDADQDFDRGGAGINGSFGYFYNENFEMSVRQSVNFDGRGNDDEWAGSTRLAADWHFLLGKFVPFVGANFGLTYTEDDSAWGIGPEVGFKYYVHERTFIFALGEYRWHFDELDQLDDTADDGSFAFTVGVGFNVGGR
jgi:hypothetical protein